MTTTRQYDYLNRLTSIGSANASAVVLDSHGYAYNPANQRTSGTNADGSYWVYQYDSLGQVTSGVKYWADGSVVAGNLQTLRYGNGVTNLYQYDARNRLTNLVWRFNASPLASFAYQLGVTGNRAAAGENVNGVGRGYVWNYDLLYRLTGETIGGMGSVGYGYDAVGNRLNRQSTIAQLPVTTSSYNANDLLASDGYDHNGNTTTSGANGYQYDALNHLVNVNNGQILLGYDGDGRRAGKTVDGLTTLYLVDERNPSGYAQVMEEFTVGGTTNLTRAYIYGLSLISQGLIGTGTNFYGTDGHGSVRFLLSTNGTITDTYTYDAYGTLIASTGTTPNRYLYSSEQFDSDLGFYYLRARYLSPNTGRFWTMDTFQGDQEDPLSLHKYLYVADSPLDKIDPSGLEYVDVYIWNPKVFTGGLPSVGHVMITKHNSQEVYVSQFPHGPGAPSRWIGPNTKLQYAQTFSEEGRPQNQLYVIWVPNEQKFHNEVNYQVNTIKLWYWKPQNDVFSQDYDRRTRTQCANAAYYALREGGVTIDPADRYGYGGRLITPTRLGKLLDGYYKAHFQQSFVPLMNVNVNTVDFEISVPINF